MKETHAKELDNVIRAKDKIIADYKDANLELQRHVPPEHALTSQMHHSTAASTAAQPSAAQLLPPPTTPTTGKLITGFEGLE